MDKALKLLLILAFCLSAPAQTMQQGIIMSGPLSGPGTGTLSFVQQGTCTASGTTCVATMGTGALTTGNVYEAMCFTANFTPTAITTITTSSPVETYTTGSNLTTSVGASMGQANNGWSPWDAYVLPGSAVGGGGTVTVTFAASVGSNGGCLIQEWHPSANGANIGLASDNVFQTPTASTSILGPAFTANGTGNVTFQGVTSTGSFVNPSSVSSPYSTHEFLQDQGYAGAVSVANPTWTMASSVAGVTNELSLAYNPTAFAEQGFEDFEGCTNGSAPTVACLQSSQHGWQGCLWQIGSINLMKTTTAANQPLANATGLLNDGVSYAAGAGSLGMGITYNGSDASDFIICNWNPSGGPGSPAAPNVSVGMWWFGDQPAAGGVNDNIDAITLHGGSDFAAVNYYGTGAARFVRLETPEGNGAAVTVPASTWLWIDLLYAANGTASLTAYDCVSGSPPTCTLQTVGTSTHAMAVTPDYAYKLEIGQEQGSEAPDSGTHSFWDSVKLSLTGASLLP